MEEGGKEGCPKNKRKKKVNVVQIVKRRRKRIQGVTQRTKEVKNGTKQKGSGENRNSKEM